MQTIPHGTWAASALLSLLLLLILPHGGDQSHCSHTRTAACRDGDGFSPAFPGNSLTLSPLPVGFAGLWEALDPLRTQCRAGWEAHPGQAHRHSSAAPALKLEFYPISCYANKQGEAIWKTNRVINGHFCCCFYSLTIPEGAILQKTASAFSVPMH